MLSRIAPAMQRTHAIHSSRLLSKLLQQQQRLSDMPSFPVAPPSSVGPPPPREVTKEVAIGVQSATRLFLRYGLGQKRLQAIAQGAGNNSTLVTRWQMMMEAFLASQVHVLSGLGYAPDGKGLGLYNQHLAMFIQQADPTTQEELRITGRDIWRHVLSTAFDVSLGEIEKNELSVVDARNVMHRVSQKMQEPATLESISQKCSTFPASSNAAADMTQKHQIIQNVLVHEVYLGGNPSLVSECGFEDGEKGYVFMQCIMAEHQNDPLIAQYIGSAMMNVLKTAGLDMATLQHGTHESEPLPPQSN